MSQELMGRFLEECGARGPLELVAEDSTGASVGRWKLPQPFAIVGSEAKADVQLPADEVSKRHLYLQVIRGRVFGLDLESRAGVKWGGIRATSWWVRPGESIEVGRYVLRVVGGLAGEGLDAEPLSDDGRPGPESPLTELVGTEDGVESRWLEVLSSDVRKPLARRLTLVGRSNDCKVRIQDERLSRHHCALLQTARSVWAVDLLSREGIRLGDARVPWGIVSEDDQLRIGGYRIAIGKPRSSTSRALRLVTRASLSRVERTRPDATEARLHAESLPVAVDPMLQQFGALQQQMVDRFSDMQAQAFDQMHQMMQMMFQMFGTLHRDQMNAVREEMAKVRELTAELQTLQPRAGGRGGESTAASSSDGHVVSNTAPELPVSLLTGSDRRAENRRTEHRVEPAATVKLSNARRTEPRSMEHSDIHGLLCEKIEKLQQERASRWQRILVMMTGHAS